MSRKPIYHDKPKYRVVSRANGLWMAQVRMEERGSRVRDPWHDLQAVGRSLEDAIAKMNAEAS